MAWRGQGGRRAKGRRGDQDPELDNTAWLADLEQEAVRADDEDEDDWADTLRGRRSQAASPDSGPTSPPAPEPGWAPDPAPPTGAQPYEPAPGGAGGAGYAPDAWSPDPTAPPPAPDLDWSWPRPTPGASADPVGPAPGEPPPAEFAGPGPGSDAGYGEPRPDVGAGGGWEGSGGDPGDGGWRSAGVETPTGSWEAPEPVGREPDYPALFGELYRRSAGQRDPVWEAAFDQPMPEHGPPDPQPAAWPFEETTQSWEPSDRSFIWPADELPSPSAEWDQPAPPSWLDDPAPPPAAHPTTPGRSDPDPDQTAAWSSPWAAQPEYGNGAPPPTARTEPPPEDWAAAIPTDVPAARRAADPSTRMWRPDELGEPEPGVPLGPGPGLRAPAAGEGPASRTTRLQRAAGEGLASRAADPRAEAGQDPVARAFGARAADRDVPLFEEPDEEPPKARRNRQGERQARAWPRIVAVISWIVLVMVVCWFYVFPWLERVLPENF